MKKIELTKTSLDQVKTALKEKFSTLTEKDLNDMEGKEDKLHKLLQDKLGKSRTEVDQIIEKVHSSLKGKLGNTKA